jgi:hypothetical protein
MKTMRIRTLFASCVLTMLLLNISPALAGNLNEIVANKGKIPGRVEVIFLKWIADLPNMAGLVSGDPGGGLFAGEILEFKQTERFTRIEALYHINGKDFQFTAHNHILQDNLKGTAVIQGVVEDGPMKGARVRGEYKVIAPCGIINAQQGDAGDVCFQGTLTVKAGFGE